MTSWILPEAAPISSIVATTRPKICTASRAAPEFSPAIVAACAALSALDLTVPAICSIDEAVSSRLAAMCSVRPDRSFAPDAISVVAVTIASLAARTSVTIERIASCIARRSSISSAASSRPHGCGEVTVGHRPQLPRVSARADDPAPGLEALHVRNPVDRLLGSRPGPLLADEAGAVLPRGIDQAHEQREAVRERSSSSSSSSRLRLVRTQERPSQGVAQTVRSGSPVGRTVSMRRLAVSATREGLLAPSSGTGTGRFRRGARCPAVRSRAVPPQEAAAARRASDSRIASRISSDVLSG